MTGLLAQPAVLAGAAIVIILVCLVLAFTDGGARKQGQRVDRIRMRAQGLVKATELKLRRNELDKRLLDLIMRRLLPQPDLIRARLRRTGRSIGIGSYGAACVIVAAATGLTIAIFRFSPAAALVGGLLAGLWLPHMAIGRMANRRALRFTVLFPDAIGLMVRNIKSGLPITESFQIVGQELADPVGAEFRQISDQIRLGQPIDQVLGDAARRISTPEVNFLVVTLSIQRETGGNLAETLENLDNILRRRRQMRLKVKAMSSEARASAMIIGALPFVMMALLSLVNPDYLSLLFTRPLGHTLLAVGAGSIGMGVFIMAKMVRFEI